MLLYFYVALLRNIKIYVCTISLIIIHKYDMCIDGLHFWLELEHDIESRNVYEEWSLRGFMVTRDHVLVCTR